MKSGAFESPGRNTRNNIAVSQMSSYNPDGQLMVDKASIILREYGISPEKANLMQSLTSQGLNASTKEEQTEKILRTLTELIFA